MLWLTFFFLLVWLMFISPGWKKAFWQAELTGKGANGIAVVIILVFFSTTILVSHFTLEQFPNSSDEYAYLMQAKTLSHGKLAEKAPLFPAAFHYNHIAIKDHVRVGRFPPGWPLLLSTSFLLGIPSWLINPLLGALALLVFYLFARQFYSTKVAVWSLAALALSGYFVFNSASFFSHISCLLMTVLFVWAMRLFQASGKVTYLFLAGFCIGLIGVTRYYTAMLIFLPFLIHLIHRYKKDAIFILLQLAIGVVPWILFLLWYNYKLTGNPLMPVTVWAYQDEQLGFVKGHTVVKGMEHVLRWMFMFFYWCSPGLLLLYFLLLWKKVKSATARWTHPEDYLFIVLMAGYFFYYQIGGNQYGPRFLLEALPFLILFVVRSVSQWQSSYRAALLVAGVIFAVVKFPFIADREARVVDERQDLFDLVRQKGISKAVVFVNSPTGIIRPMPIGDLTRNESDFNSEVVYAQELMETTGQLMSHYKGRSFYRYVRKPDQPRGELIPIHPRLEEVTQESGAPQHKLLLSHD